MHPLPLPGADLAGVVFLAGVLWAIARRYVQRPYRIRIKSKPEHAVILGTFFVLGATGFVAEGFRIALYETPGVVDDVPALGHKLLASLASRIRDLDRQYFG